MSLKNRVKKGESVSRKLSDAYYKKMNLIKKGIDPNEFHMGMNIELEHFDVTKGDLTQTAKITLAHLRELPDYNTRLEKMEEKGKKKLKKKKRKYKKYETFLFDDEDD